MDRGNSLNRQKIWEVLVYSYVQTSQNGAKTVQKSYFFDDEVLKCYVMTYIIVFILQDKEESFCLILDCERKK